jgi:hypothetical protein
VPASFQPAACDTAGECTVSAGCTFSHFTSPLGSVMIATRPPSCTSPTFSRLLISSV